MSDRQDPTHPGDLGHLPDGRPKLSPDDTSLLGLHAVWSEIDEPLPPKGAVARHGTRRVRRQARTAWRVPLSLVIGISAAVVLTLAIIVFLATS